MIEGVFHQSGEPSPEHDVVPKMNPENLANVAKAELAVGYEIIAGAYRRSGWGTAALLAEKQAAWYRAAIKEKCHGA